MFTNISWSQFGATVLSLSAIYYIGMLWLYYRGDIQRLIKAKIRPAIYVEVERSIHNTEHNENASANETITYDASDAGNISDLINDIKTVIQVAKDSEANRTELLTIIKRVLAQYPDLKISAHKVPINEFIIDQCKTLALDLSVAQAHALWVSDKQ